MSAVVSFDQLLGLLPAGGLHGKDSPEFGVASEPEIFVPPALNVVDNGSPAAVTLVSARGATGKSTLAEVISARKRAPLWRLDQDLNVGGHALRVKLDDYLGINDALGSLPSGSFLIVDALDEALMRVSGSSWNEFVASLADSVTRGLELLLLGRERVLEDVWADLADRNTALNWFEISHFDPEQRARYVDLRTVAQLDKTNSAYVDARSAVLNALAGTVDSEQADSFVGYAPVLDAVAALLGSGNLIETKNSFTIKASDGRHVAVLANVLEKLLERERGKVEQLAEQLGLNKADVYTAPEQLEWLAAELMGGNVPDLTWCPESLRGIYAQQVQEFVNVHPFRSDKGKSGWASPVFSAYVAARRFGDMQVRSELKPIGMATGLLFEFVAAAEDELSIDEWQFAALHASLMAAEWRAVEGAVSIAAGDPFERDDSEALIEEVAGELVLSTPDAEHRATPFRLMLDRPNSLLLKGPITSLSVEFPAKVVIDSGASVNLGPDCFIRCADLSIAGDTVQIVRRQRPDAQINSEAGGADVIFEVTSQFSCEAMLTGSPAMEVFELYLPVGKKMVYPWVLYQKVLDPPAREPNDRALRFINMMMNLLRNHGHKGPPAVFDKKLEGRQSIKGDEFKRAISKLQAHGVVVMKGPLILLSPSWESERFSGKTLEGLTTLEGKREKWMLVLDEIAALLKR